MKLIFHDHSYQYETERLFRGFFPPAKLELSRSAEDAEGDFCLTEIRQEGGRRTALVRLRVGERELSRERSIPPEAPPAEEERILSVLLYEVLSEYTGLSLPWGILTGVRPVKVLSRLSDEEAERQLLVSPRRIALSRRIQQTQRRLAESVPPSSYSLYISVPFCPTRCSYCSFVSHSVESAAGRMDEYVEKLCAETRRTAEIAKALGMTLDTVYVGGGTPTSLSAEQLKRLLGALDAFDLSRMREFTVEAGRPDTITAEKLRAIKQAGAGRVSVNPQTMSGSVLRAIGRAHTPEQTEQAFFLAREEGFRNINMDIIAGLPTDSFEGFAESLERVCALSPENITVHSLSLKRASYLFGSEFSHSAAEAVRMIEHSHRVLEERGYSPYYLYRQKNTAAGLENTGYARPDTEGIYNMYSMEELQTILAVGAGAVSKLIDGGRLSRICNCKYPYEYLDRFNDILARKQDIFDFFV